MGPGITDEQIHTFYSPGISGPVNGNKVPTPVNGDNPEQQLLAIGKEKGGQE